MLPLIKIAASLLLEAGYLINKRGYLTHSFRIKGIVWHWCSCHVNLTVNGITVLEGYTEEDIACQCKKPEARTVER